MYTMLCNKSYLSWWWEFTRSYVTNAGGDLGDSRVSILPSVPRIATVYTCHSLLTACFHSQKCPGLGKNYTVTLVIVSLPLKYK